MGSSWYIQDGDMIQTNYKYICLIWFALYPSIQMSTNLSRESRYASVLWIEGAPHTLKELNDIWDELQNEKDAKRHTMLKNSYDEAVMENTVFIENFFGSYFTPEENAVQVCHDEFGLPDFDEMDKYILGQE